MTEKLKESEQEVLLFKYKSQGFTDQEAEARLKNTMQGIILTPLQSQYNINSP